ncbi:Type III restriction enzyme, res subunit [Pelotomaculum sp. FP]|uniref:DEAD/DEAH box helicase n=1 Tax=Pelotomaculum sp. FP TaxID=261474 RepID=UPI0010654BF4|nr:DEAD/DEAH box helicase family protein [Pelotomaculum sp. FP]TEB17512.1 Type III restriction enzyme, res subunit [Pelotomaculum sp. FP]
MLNSNAKFINNRLALRPPQKESLERFQQIVDILSLSKNPDLEEELRKIREIFPTLTSFEREFPSVCFALATGIGKTRLMGALIAYLHYQKGIKNFFVMAPNLTIYKKLKADLGDPSCAKYVFRGLDKFVNPPRIIDGDNYEEFRQLTTNEILQPIVINIFNISKLNSESRTADGKPARIKRLNEVLGESYFQYLQSLPDLCIFMDESHHYHADRSFDVINELRPILGVELTATPQIQNGARKIDFKNVVYEYSLAHALNDGLYVKVPAVFTRKDFRPEEYTPEQLDREKLNDGIRLHEETKSKLDVYARTYGKQLVKPFVLVVAKDTEHSRQIKEYLTSTDFFRGYYKDKVLEINSAQRGAEKDENIELLLSLEQPDNRIEIVIHVNMLKEGWDVTNLYTIIPLRASASETLTEQTIGRGLRLPYGQRTGEDEVDRLSIVSHDRYEAIVRLANDPNSLVRRVYYIDPAEPQSDDQRETLEMPTVYDELTSAESFTEQLAFTLRETATNDYVVDKAPEQTVQVAQFVARLASKTVMELGKQVKTFDAARDEEIKKLVHTSIVSETIRQFPALGLKKEDLTAVVEKAIDTCTQALTENVIPIPQAVVQPFTEVKHGFYDFELDTRNMNWHPSDDTLIGTELQEGGETFEYHTGFALFPKTDTVENEIVRHIIVHDNVDYSSCADLIYSLIADAKRHFLSYLNPEETEKVMRDRQRSLAEIIYAQMNEHFYKEETSYRASGMRPFTRIETGFGGKFKSDDLYDLRANLSPSEVKTKIFKGFKKACHTLYKFDSNTERIFAIVLENDGAVLKWMRPSAKQFNIYYGPGGISRYEPDFVVETSDVIYMVETKASDDVQKALQDKSGDVWEKAIAGQEYCRAVTEWNAKNGGKPWKYALISHDEVRLQSSFMYLVKNRLPMEQLEL